MKNAMQLGFFFDQTRCSGCYTCVLACRQWHSIENEVMNWRRVETFENGTFPDVKVSFFSLSCMQCQTPPCVSSCPVSAIFKREKDGIVLVDSEKCLGEPDCGLCKKACPYQIPQFNPNLDFWINPVDARARKIENRQKVRVFNDRGELWIHAKVTQRIMPGVVAIGVRGLGTPLMKKVSIKEDVPIP